MIFHSTGNHTICKNTYCQSSSHDAVPLRPPSVNDTAAFAPQGKRACFSSRSSQLLVMGLPGADSGKVNFQVLLALRGPVPQGKSSEECGGARPAVRGKVHKGWFKYPMGSRWNNSSIQFRHKSWKRDLQVFSDWPV